jgi:hypothetical protein
MMLQRISFRNKPETCYYFPAYGWVPPSPSRTHLITLLSVFAPGCDLIDPLPSYNCPKQPGLGRNSVGTYQDWSPAPTIGETVNFYLDFFSYGCPQMVALAWTILNDPPWPDQNPRGCLPLSLADSLADLNTSISGIAVLAGAFAEPD